MTACGKRREREKEPLHRTMLAGSEPQGREGGREEGTNPLYIFVQDRLETTHSSFIFLHRTQFDSPSSKSQRIFSRPGLNLSRDGRHLRTAPRPAALTCARAERERLSWIFRGGSYRSWYSGGFPTLTAKLALIYRYLQLCLG